MACYQNLQRRKQRVSRNTYEGSSQKPVRGQDAKLQWRSGHGASNLTRCTSGLSALRHCSFSNGSPPTLLVAVCKHLVAIRNADRSLLCHIIAVHGLFNLLLCPPEDALNGMSLGSSMTLPWAGSTATRQLATPNAIMNSALKTNNPGGQQKSKSTAPLR